MNECVCRDIVYTPQGPEEANIAIIASSPVELKKVYYSPYDDSALPGRVIRKELLLAGIPFSRWRATFLWHHVENDREDCLNWNARAAILEVKQAQYVLLMGSGASQFFLDENVGTISGLWMESRFLPGRKIMACPGILSVMNGTVGEFRLALRKFVTGVQKNE